MTRGRKRVDADKVDLTYLGPATIFIDKTTGLRWEVGQTQRVTSDDVERIAKAVPQDKWSQVKAMGDPPVNPPEEVPAPGPEPTPGF